MLQFSSILILLFAVLIQIEKKHGVVARVKCRNFKDYCPEPACDEPVLLPGHCCKSCPGTQQAGDEWELSNMPGGLLFSGSRGRANSRTPLPLLNHHHHAAQHHHLDEPALPLRQPPTQNKAISTQDLNDIPQLPAAPSDEILPEAVGMAEKTSSSPSSGKGCTFGLEREFHQEGSEWHPYLAPFGFDRCTLCSCQVSLNKPVSQPVSQQTSNQTEKPVSRAGRLYANVLSCVMIRQTQT